MDNKDFKKEFCTTAKKYGFRTAFGCCYKESSECLFVLELQKSNYSNLYYLNLKTYIQGVFGIRYTIHKDYLKKDMGDIFNRQPPEYSSIFDLEVDTPNEKRIKTNTSGKATRYWTRTPVTGWTTAYILISANGRPITTDAATKKQGVVFGFCIGSK